MSTKEIKFERGKPNCAARFARAAAAMVVVTMALPAATERLSF